MMEELKACPFCGSTNVAISPYDGAKTIVCINCLCQTASYRGEDAEANATAAWNRRAAPENKPLTLKQLRGMDGEPVWIVLLNIAKQSKYEIVTEVHEDGIWMVCADDDNDYASFGLYGKTWLAYARKPERKKLFEVY